MTSRAMQNTVYDEQAARAKARNLRTWDQLSRAQKQWLAQRLNSQQLKRVKSGQEKVRVTRVDHG